MLSATFDDRGAGANYPAFSADLTRSRAIFRDPEILYIIRRTCCTSQAPLEFFFQEQSYSSLLSGFSLAWDHVRGDIDDPCGAIADFCGVIADPCGVVAIPEAIGGRAVVDAATPIVARLAKHHKTLLNIVKHHETHVKHCDTS